MKCSEESRGIVTVLALVIDDIAADKTGATMQTCYEMLVDQLEMLRILEDLSKHAPTIK